MALTKWDPFGDILFLQEQMSRIFDEALMKYKGGGLSGGGVAPPVDIYETDTDIVLKAEVPGIEIEDVSIEVEENTLVLKGERKLKKGLEEENFHRMERFYGSFQRVFSLPNIVEKDKIKASLRDGLLEIHIPKTRESRSGEVRIEVE
jgi:HSP20 family protein